jgi:high-affinity iron transporter
MLASFLLSLREGIEAALIIGIVLGAVNKLSRRDLTTSAWYGTVCAILVSLVAGITLTVLGLSLEGAAEHIFEGLAMLAAACVLTWMIFWMNGQARYIKGELESGVSRASSSGGGRAIFSLAFLAVVREGIELALFLTAATFATDPQSTISGAIPGLSRCTPLASSYLLTARLTCAILPGYWVLLSFAAGLVAQDPRV